MSSRPHRVVIDTDPGIDDALAILLAVASPEITIEALTVVGGNTTPAQALANSLAVLELAGAAHIPVAAGVERPLVQPPLVAEETHGSTGLGYAVLPEPVTPADDAHAVDLIVDTVMANPGEIDIVALGPLTNLALAVRREPAVVDRAPGCW